MTTSHDKDLELGLPDSTAAASVSSPLDPSRLSSIYTVMSSMDLSGKDIFFILTHQKHHAERFSTDHWAYFDSLFNLPEKHKKYLLSIVEADQVRESHAYVLGYIG